LNRILVAAAVTGLLAAPARAASAEPDLVVPVFALRGRTVWAGGFSAQHVSYVGAGASYTRAWSSSFAFDLGGRAGLATFDVAKTGTMQTDALLGFRYTLRAGRASFGVSARANGGYAIVTHAGEGVSRDGSYRVDAEPGADVGVGIGRTFFRFLFAVAYPIAAPEGAPAGGRMRFGVTASVPLPDVRQPIIIGVSRVEDWYPDRSGNPASFNQVLVGFPY
jgi:hypothetical protein